MAETIRINVLVISAESENLTKRRIITLATTLDNTIDQLRPMIKERFPSLFEEVLPDNIVLRKTESDSWENISIQFDQYKRKEFYGCREMFPYELNSKHFLSQPFNEKIHVIVTIE